MPTAGEEAEGNCGSYIPGERKSKKVVLSHLAAQLQKSRSPKQKAAGMRSMHTKAGLHQCTTPLIRWLRTTFLLFLSPGMNHGCFLLLPRLWAFWLFARRTTHGSPHKVVLGTLVHALLTTTKVSVSQAEGGRYAEHAHESWPPSTYDATHLHLRVVYINPRIKGPHLGVI